MSDERVDGDSGSARKLRETRAGAASTRRGLLVGAGAAGTAAVLAACGTDNGDNPYLAPPGAGDSTPDDSFTPTEAPTEASGETPDEGSGENAEGLVATADVAVGGGVILEEDGIVITQPAQGEWRGFSSVCTHQGCTVASVADNTINCNCHGSQFSIADGSVVTAASGVDPSQQDPLPAVEVEVSDGWVVLA
jgi:Rieske Fe-S protein